MYPTKIPFYISVRVCIQSHCISGWHVTKIDLKSLNVKQQGFDPSCRKTFPHLARKSHHLDHLIPLMLHVIISTTVFSVPCCATPHLKHVCRFKRLISTATSCCFFFFSRLATSERTHASGFTQNSAEKNLNLFGFFDLKAYSGKQASDIQWECLFTGCLLNSKPENQSRTQVSETPEAFYQTINLKTANRESQLRCSRHEKEDKHS